MPYKNSEKRKEKSRDAARSRRGKESEVFYDLASILPLSSSTVSQLDKASVMRVAISHLRLRHLLGPQVKSTNNRSDLDDKIDRLYSRAIEGFCMVITKDADIMYLSDKASDYLGLSQIDMIGHSLYDFAHPCDHDEIQEILHERSGEDGSSDQDFFVRMKCTLTTKGKSVNLKSAVYKVLHCTGHYLHGSSDKHPHMPGLEDNAPLLVLIAEPIPHPANIEVPLDSRTFVSRHSLNMRFTHCDDRVEALLGYSGSQLITQSLYDFHHALDTEHIDKAFKTLFSKGQMATGKYRFLAQNGGYVWMETQATVIYDHRTDKPLHVVCINFVISEVQDRGFIMSHVQLPQSVVEEIPDEEEEEEEEEEQEDESLGGMKFSTMDILQSGRALHLDDNLCKPQSIPKGLMLEELAPRAGDALVPLDEDDDTGLFEGVSLPRSQESAHSDYTGSTLSNKDLPFLNLSAPLGGLQSMCIDSGREADMMISSFNSCDEETCIQTSIEEFDMRAPYITMDGNDDLLFGASEPVLLVDGDDEPQSMLGITESVFAPNPDLKSKDQNGRQLPMSVLRLQANGSRLPVSVGDLARNAGPPKMKRPMEINRLETGPPVCKVLLLEDSELVDTNKTSYSTAQLCSADAGTPSGGSVLMNLLMKGVDVNHGYKLKSPASRTQESLSRSTLKHLPPVKLAPDKLAPDRTEVPQLVIMETPGCMTII